MLKTLWNDETGAILSAELVLIMTILVIGMIVGLSELQDAVVNELNDVGEAIGSLNQSFFFHGQSGRQGNTIKSITFGSFFLDRTDNCDGNECAISCDVPVPEIPKGL
jgi:Flp pilus assembly pilin Flp